MRNDALTAQSPASTLDPASHDECLDFIRQAIAAADRETAHNIAGVVKETCERGYADRAAIWQSLTQSEQTEYRTLLAADNPNSPPPKPRKLIPGEFELGDRVVTPAGARGEVVGIWYTREGQECWVQVDGCALEFQASELAADCGF